jgi:hypothetical protein
LTLWKRPGRAVGGLVVEEGRGSGKEPHLYEWPGMVEMSHPDLLASFHKSLASDAESSALPLAPWAFTRRGPLPLLLRRGWKRATIFPLAARSEKGW